MKFRTEVNITPSPDKIEIEDAVFSIGSCFASEMSLLLQKGQLQTLSNPYGTLFNPYSVMVALQHLHDCQYYRDEDLITFGGNYISLDHYTGFDTGYAHQTLEKINRKIDEGNQFLQHAKWVLVTYGSAFIYDFLPKRKPAANCHRIPQKFFNKRMLSHEELLHSVQESILLLKDICPPDAQILFTVSPVRHLRDGVVENQLSKSRLIAALHDATEGLDYCHYLPVYEIMMDDLRDYRFYKEDMLHPNEQAVQYIFGKFGNAFFSEETQRFISENFKISQALNHRPGDPKSKQYLDFRQKLEERIAEQQKKVKHQIFTVSTF